MAVALDRDLVAERLAAEVSRPLDVLERISSQHADVYYGLVACDRFEVVPIRGGSRLEPEPVRIVGRLTEVDGATVIRYVVEPGRASAVSRSAALAISGVALLVCFGYVVFSGTSAVILLAPIAGGFGLLARVASDAQRQCRHEATQFERWLAGVLPLKATPN